METRTNGIFFDRLEGGKRGSNELMNMQWCKKPCPTAEEEKSCKLWVTGWNKPWLLWKRG